MVRITPFRSQRRPEVTAGVAMQYGRHRRLSRREMATSSISGRLGKPPTASNALRETKIAWSPVATPVARERQLIIRATTVSSG